MSDESPGAILQLSTDFLYQQLYERLVNALSRAGVPQVVFSPIRRGKGPPARGALPEGVQLCAPEILRSYHKILFRARTHAVTKAVRQVYPPSALALVHAHFLFTDGAVARELWGLAGVPYVVAVRNTDLNYYWRLRPDLRSVGRRILSEAAAVIFLSPSYRTALLGLLPPKEAAAVASKARVIPNGIEDHWLSATTDRRESAEGIRVLYVGDFTQNKNVPSLIEAVRIARRFGDVKLTLVGSGGGDEQRVAGMARDNGEFVTWNGRLTDEAQLRQVYQAHDLFAMASFRESFGIAYLEALSQGLPILFSRGQGIDGYPEISGVSAAVNPSDTEEIARQILSLGSRAAELRAQCSAAAARFTWARVAHEYKSLYSSARLREAE